MTLYYFLKLVMLVYTISHSVTSSDDDVEGYYWRNYKHIIPKDAFKAAYTKDNKPLYVGQVLHQHLLIPAIIDPFAQKVIYEWGREEIFARADQNVKILCTRHPEQMQWIQTRNGFIQNVHGKIDGGYELSVSIYIGRTILDGEYILGKITVAEYTSSTNVSHLHTSKNGVVQEHNKFEVLTYNPNIKKVNHINSISNSVNPQINLTKQIVINYYV